MRNFRPLMAAAASLGLAIVTAWICAEGLSAPNEWFMPGPLGAEQATAAMGDQRGGGPARPTTSTNGFLARAIGLRAGEEAKWGHRNECTESLNFIHHLSTVFPPTMAKLHPEFFPLVAGKRYRPVPNFTNWNPDLGCDDVAHFAADQAAVFFDQHPRSETYSLGVNDALIFGESPETLALVMPQRWFRGRPDYSRLVFTFMNRAAADLAQTHPDKYLGCLAYYWCENAPPFRVDPHVIPFLTADRSQSYDPKFVREEFDLQSRWGRVLGATARGPEGRRAGGTDGRWQTADGGKRITDDGWRRADGGRPSSGNVSISSQTPIKPRLGLYDYLDGQGFLVPRVPIHAFAEHIRHAYEVGFTDYYGESSRNWGLDGPLPWVIAQLLQDPEQNTDRLLDRYYHDYFQQAAGPMRAFFDLCEHQWMTQSGSSYWLKYYRSQTQAVLYPPSVRVQLRRYLDEAAALAQVPEGQRPGGTEGPVRNVSVSDFQHVSLSNLVAQRVQFVSDSFGVTEHYCEFQEARAALGTAILGKELHGRSGEALLLDYLDKRIAFIRYAHAVTQKWPLAFYPINYDDWIRDNPAFAAVVALTRPEAGRRTADDGRRRAEELKTEDGGPRTDGRRRTAEVQRTGGRTTDGGRRRAEDGRRTAEREGRGHWATRSDAGIQAGRAVAEAIREGRIRELPINGGFEGPVVLGLRIAGLQYGFDLPAPWHSSVEPTERSQGVLIESPKAGGRMADDGGRRADDGRRTTDSGPETQMAGVPEDQMTDDGGRTEGKPASQRYLRISGAENTTVYQWIRANPGALYTAAMQVRGVVSSSDAVTLTLGWMDAQQRHIGTVVVMRLPDGRWPKWVQLRQGAHAPPNAAWLGIGFRIQHQMPGDWAEFANISLGVVSPGEAGEAGKMLKN